MKYLTAISIVCIFIHEVNLSNSQDSLLDDDTETQSNVNEEVIC